MKHAAYIFLIFGLMLLNVSTFGQLSDSIEIPQSPTGYFRLNAIHIVGNNKTKPYIITREIKVKSGDTIPTSKLYETIASCKELIYNTNLFNTVKIVPILNSAFEMDLRVEVVERWYIYPSPQFKLTDRNFNEWWKVYNHDLERVIYGIKFSHYNLSGRNDALNVNWLNGYARNYTLAYSLPYINKKMTRGLSFSTSYVQSREFPYKTTSDNRLLQYRNERFSRTSFSFQGALRIRNTYYTRSALGVQLNYIKVSDSLLQPKYNPNYFGMNQSSAWFTDLFYSHQYINVDNVNYPRKGKAYQVTINKRGLGWSGGINMLSLDLSYRRFYKLPHSVSANILLSGKLKLPFRQSYLNQRAMGYGDHYMDGLEYYVIDGVASSLAKAGLNKKVLHFKIPMPFKWKEIPYVPFTFYAKTFANMGYTYNQPEFRANLNNRFLYSGGIGIDILTLYDLRLSVEYSMNQLGEKGLFLHTRGNL